MASSSTAAELHPQQPHAQHGTNTRNACAASGGRSPPLPALTASVQLRRRGLLPLIALAVVALLMMVSSLPLLVVSTRHGSLPRHGAPGDDSASAVTGCGGWGGWLTVVLPTTFRDAARALASLSSVRLHMHPDLLAEVVLVTPWEEFLVLRHALAPTLAGPSCPIDCYSPPSAGDASITSTGSSGSSSRGRRVSRVPTALRAAGLSPRLNTEANFGPCGVNRSAGGGVGPPSEGLECGPPVWVVPEHVVLRISRQELKSFKPNGYRLQMVLKLAVSWLVSTPHFLVMDSDVLQVRHVSPATAHWLFPAPGRALYQPQRRATHAKWWTASESLLGLRGCLDSLDDRGQGKDAHVFGVTPAILSTRIAAETVAYWERRMAAVAANASAAAPPKKKGRGVEGGGGASRSLLGDGGEGEGVQDGGAVASWLGLQHEQQPQQQVPARALLQAGAAAPSAASTPASASVAARRRAAWLAALSVLLPTRSPFFTEYTSYHLVAECVMGRGTLLRHHVSPWARDAPPAPAVAAAAAAVAQGAVTAGGSSGTAAAADREQAPRLYRGIWRRGGGGGVRGNNASGGMTFDWGDPQARVTPCADCLFLVVQSNMGVPERRVMGDLQALLLLGGGLLGEEEEEEEEGAAADGGSSLAMAQAEAVQLWTQ
ncbi:hypothetical protein HXX76_005501 [Chlamydomonas incerta]|uniref:Uncharacterized protein n=1 Tax=Chlamydomonas incerta TaxID=51695 RepID=A0A835TCK2_CHLIN|nr:hypothetical protein HXX76_005501 [Chlamydomonas incerta]|eukprot:KAG2437884.1 hypothetical protein HXX76_005501 [Chlamydomonas incerta]